jgi:hypothetical protein
MADRDRRSTDEWLLQAGEEFLRRAALGGDDAPTWQGRAGDLLEHMKMPARSERDCKDGVYMMEFSKLFQRCRSEDRLLTDGWPPAV